MDPQHVVEALRSGTFEAVRQAGSSEFREQISADEVRRVWNELSRELGKLRAAEPDVVVHDLALTFDGGPAHLQIAYRDGQIAGLVLKPGSPTGHFGT